MIYWQTAALFIIGMLQGINLVAFPAVSPILTSAQGFNYSNSAYGYLFLPQVILSIIFSFLSTEIALRGKIKIPFLLGLVANVLAMALLAFSVQLQHDPDSAYIILLGATGCIGIGFGLLVPFLNALTAEHFPKKIDSAILILNALLGLGTALSPVLVTLFTKMAAWWQLPICLAAAFTFMLLCSLALPLQLREKTDEPSKARLPMQFWLFAFFALLYGMLETVNGNWASLYMSSVLGSSLTKASLALSSFWLMVTLGRVFFAPFSKQTTFRSLPLLIALSLAALSLIRPGGEVQAILAFGVAGIGCSALLPLTISFATEQITGLSSSAAGAIIAFYLMGYGISAFGVGPMEHLLGVNLRVIFAISGGIAIILTLLASYLVKSSKPHGGKYGS